MNKTNEIVCMTTTYTIFRYYQVFPKKGTELNPGIVFYLKLVFMCVLASVILIGSLLHLINTIRNNDDNHIGQDITYVISMISSYFVLVFFSLKTDVAARMIMFLSNFEEFGKPINFANCNSHYNKLSKYHYVYLNVIITAFLLSSNLFKIDQCKKENLEYGFNEICGLIANAWMPFEIDYVPVKQIFVLLQLFSLYYLYVIAGLNTFTVMETVEHIIVRLDHVKYLFTEALKEDDKHIRRQNFNFAVKYHIRVLQLEKNLNECFSYCMLTHMGLTGAILGCGVYSFTQEKSINPLLVAVGWFFGLLLICRSGQLLADKSLEITPAIYNSNWTRVEVSLQRDIVFVIMRSQKPMVLRAAGFGVMNHAMLVTVSKAAYSYITLLSQTA